MEQLKRFLDSPQKLQKEIDKIKGKIEKLVGHKNTHNAYTKQAQGLGYYMIHRENKIINQMHNAVNIYEGLWETNNPFSPKGPKEKVIHNIDVLASLYAIRYSGLNNRAKAVTALNTHSEGIVDSMKIFTNYMKESNKELYEGAASFLVKGYTAPKTGATITTMVSTKDDLAYNTKILGMKVIRKIEEAGRGTEDKYLLASANYESDRLKGGMEIMNYGHSGMTLREMLKLDGKVIEEADGVIEAYKRARTSYLYKDEELDLDTEKVFMAPLLDLNGNVIDYRAEVSHQDKVEYLELEDSFSSTIANTITKTTAMTTGMESNEKLVDWLVMDADRNYSKHPEAYAVLSPHQGRRGAPTEMEENWALIPEYTRQYIRKIRGKDELIVRRDLLDDVIGYGAVSFADMPFIKNHRRIRTAVALLEKFWKELVSRYKAIIVVLTGDVVLGNLVSNMMMALQRGIDPITFAKQSIEAWKYLDAYEEDNRALTEAKILYKGTRSPQLKKRIEGLERRLKKNPMHPFIEDGQYTPIVEDINADKVLDKKIMDKFIGKVKKRMKFGDKVESFTDVMYANEKSSMFKKALKLTQYSDITSRYVIHQKNMKEGMSLSESLKDVDQMFVNYSYVEHRYLNFLNSIGALLFTKYLFRTPKALYKLLTKNPATVALVQGAQGMTGIDISDAYDNYYSPLDALLNRVQNPIDIVYEVSTENITNIFPEPTAAFH
jgi:hypothetical protein